MSVCCSRGISISLKHKREPKSYSGPKSPLEPDLLPSRTSSLAALLPRFLLQPYRASLFCGYKRHALASGPLHCLFLCLCAVLHTPPWLRPSFLSVMSKKSHLCQGYPDHFNLNCKSSPMPLLCSFFLETLAF